MLIGDPVDLLERTLRRVREENEQLKKQLDYLRSGKYLNQVKWERDFNEKMVEDLQEKIDSMTESYETDAEAKFYEYVDKHESKLQQRIDKVIKIFEECKMLFPHEFNWEEQVEYALEILKGELNNE